MPSAKSAALLFECVNIGFIGKVHVIGCACERTQPFIAGAGKQAVSAEIVGNLTVF